MQFLDVKTLKIARIESSLANAFVKKWHYSGKVVNNSSLHFGVFYENSLHGVMSFGCSMDKNRMIGLVTNTKWNGFLELNRMAFDDFLPKNSESRALSVALKLIKKNNPSIKWIVTFADATQCGDGTIYRASGFKLINIKKNTSLLKFNGKIIARKSLDDYNIGGKYLTSIARQQGAEALKGFQIKYIKFLDTEYEKYLTVPVLPYSDIAKVGAKMYKGLCEFSLMENTTLPSGSEVSIPSTRSNLL